jgi:hypothetical protein
MHKNKFVCLHLEEQDPLDDRCYAEGSAYRGKGEMNGSKDSNLVVFVVVDDDDDEDEQLYLICL